MRLALVCSSEAVAAQHAATNAFVMTWCRRKRKAYLLMALAATAVLAYRTMRRLRPTWQRRGRGLWRGGATK